MSENKLIPKGRAKYVTPSAPSKPRTVRCSACGRSIIEENAYCVIAGPRKMYYCSREEYEGGKAYVEKRDKFEQGILNAIKQIVCYDQNEQSYSFDEPLYNSLLAEWLKCASSEKLYHYVTIEKGALRNIIEGKQIKLISARLKYLSAVIKGNIVEYVVKKPGTFNASQMRVFNDSDFTLYTPNKEPRKDIRRSMEDLEDEYGS